MCVIAGGVGGIALLYDAYGCLISDVTADAAAFPRRADTHYCKQYYSSWKRAANTAPRLPRYHSVISVFVG
jgi:hypothetical protein